MGRGWLVLLVAVLAVGLGTAGAPVVLAKPGTGFLQICSVAGGLVSHDYTFTVADRTVTVPNGECSADIELPVGRATIIEQMTLGPPLTAVVVTPNKRLVSIDLTAHTATVRIVVGGAFRRTTATFDNCSMCVSPPSRDPGRQSADD